MSYKTIKALSRPKNPHAPVSAEPLFDDQLRQVFFNAIRDHGETMDAMGSGVYLWWDAEGIIRDAAVVNVQSPGAPTSPLERVLDLTVASYRYGGNDVCVWTALPAIMDEFPAAARRWIQERLKKERDIAILHALAAGQGVWALDTASAGEDDTLIGARDQVVADILHHHELAEFPIGWSLDRVQLTQAEAIAQMLGGNGTNWTTLDGEHFEDICERYMVSSYRDAARELRRFVFRDGSAIVDAPGGWDIEGREPFSWACAPLKELNEAHNVTIVTVDSAGRPVADSPSASRPAVPLTDEPELSR